MPVSVRRILVEAKLIELELMLERMIWSAKSEGDVKEYGKRLMWVRDKKEELGMIEEHDKWQMECGNCGDSFNLEDEKECPNCGEDMSDIRSILLDADDELEEVEKNDEK